MANIFSERIAAITTILVTNHQPPRKKLLAPISDDHTHKSIGLKQATSFPTHPTHPEYLI